VGLPSEPSVLNAGCASVSKNENLSQRKPCSTQKFIHRNKKKFITIAPTPLANRRRYAVDLRRGTASFMDAYDDGVGLVLNGYTPGAVAPPAAALATATGGAAPAAIAAAAAAATSASKAAGGAKAPNV